MAVKFSSDGKQVLFENVKAYWAKVDTPEQKYKAEKGVMEYSIQLVITEEDVEQLELNEVNKSPKTIAEKNKAIIKNAKKNGKDDPIVYEESPDDYLITVSTLAKWPDGKDKEMKVTLADGTPFKDKVGNGSIVSVIGSLSKGGADGRTLYLDKVRVEELVEVEGGSGQKEFDFEEKGGNADFDDFGDDDLPF